MIFVALGTQKFQFNRLLEMTDEMILEKKITETVYAQVGNSDYKPKYFQYTDFLDRNEFESKIKECDLLITHSGVATIIAGLKNGKKIIVVPRLEKYGEHVDDHQVQIAKSFSELNYVNMYTENMNFANLIAETKNQNFAAYLSQRGQVIETIEKFLKDM